MKDSKIEDYIGNYLIKDSKKDNKNIKKRIATIITVGISILLFLVTIAGLVWFTYNLITCECTCPLELCDGQHQCGIKSCDVCSDKYLRPLGFILVSGIFLSLFYLIPFTISLNSDD